MFARSTIRHLEEIEGFLGPEEVIFHSQDKAKVPIGLTAANKQAPLVMHVEYKVKLPDHDFVIAKQQHKLVPSVIGDMQVKAKTFSPDGVIYSGPTYIGIRSAKHLGSCAYNHLVDMKRI